MKDFDGNELYTLVRAYLSAPGATEIVRVHYDALCEWFRTHTDPDGRNPVDIDLD